jgi:Zn-finger nucleic acid-binding protein
MNCPSCGAPMRLKSDMESMRCEYCLSVYLPDKNDDGVRVLDEPADERCPLCNLQLVQATLAKCPILYCKKCGGMLVAMGALEDLIGELRAEQGNAAKPTAYDPDELRRTIQCPHCHRRMEAHLYAGPGNVVIDSCEECCMIWLDRGEAKRIASAGEHQQPQEASFSEDFTPAQDQSWIGFRQPTVADAVVDDVIDSLFR